MCIHNKGLSCTWTCLDTRSLCCSWTCPTPQGLDLHLDVSTQQRPELHRDMSGQQEPVLLLDVSTPQGLELHIDVSIPQRPVLLLDVSGQQEPVLRIEQIKKMFFFCLQIIWMLLKIVLRTYTFFLCTGLYCSCTHFMFKGFLHFTFYIQSFLDWPKKHLKMTFRDFLVQNMLTEQLLLVIITVGCVWRALFGPQKVLGFFFNMKGGRSYHREA